MRGFVIFSALLGAVTASILAPTDRQSCHTAGTQCAGAPRFQDVPVIPCCDGECSETRDGNGGIFCSETALTTVPPPTGTEASSTSETTTTPKTMTTSSTVSETTTRGVCEGLEGKPRPDAGTISQENWDLFVSGINALKAKPSSRYPGISVLDEFSRLHDDIKAHAGAMFLIWHRVMLWEFEKELNSVAPGCRIPAYDWALEGENVLTSSLFQNDRAGGSEPSEAGPRPIPGGSFKGLTTKISNTGTEEFVTRSFNYSVAHKGRDHLAEQLSVYSTYEEFGAWIEGLHSSIHLAIGGTMNSLSFSPAEPRYLSQVRICSVSIVCPIC